MSDDPRDPIAEARDAWSRLHARDRATWQLWLTVARAIAIGRAASLTVAGTNKPFGKKYTKAMKAWLVANRLDVVGQQVRWRLLLCLDHLPAIEAWLETLDATERAKYSHPDTIWMRYQAAHSEPARASAPRRPVERRAPPPNEATGSGRGAGRPVFWSEQHLRRGAEALRKCRSSDCYAIVRAIVEAAIRCEADLFELLERPNPPRPRPAAVAAPIEVHA